MGVRLPGILRDSKRDFVNGVSLGRVPGGRAPLLGIVKEGVRNGVCLPFKEAP